MLRGFFIFLIFICKPSIWTATRTTHPKLATLLIRTFRFLVPLCVRRRLCSDAAASASPAENSPLQLLKEGSSTNTVGAARIGKFYSGGDGSDADDDIDLERLKARMNRARRSRPPPGRPTFAFPQQQQQVDTAMAAAATDAPLPSPKVETQ